MKGLTSKMNLAFPTLVLEPIIHIFDQDWNSRKKVTQDGSLLTQLRQVPVNVSIETGATHFPAESLLSLEVGDTLVLDQRTEWPMQIKVAGRRKHLARAKFDASRKTFSITGQANKEEFSGHIAR
jgi:flagellar motor switch protein FliM